MENIHKVPFNGIFYDSNGDKRDLSQMIGRGVVSIIKTESVGLVDTYTMYYTDGTMSTFNIVNGADGQDGKSISSIDKTSTVGLTDTYTIRYTDNTTTTFDIINGADGQDGISPRIGVNGNWYIGETDTGILARGDAGVDGINGQDGISPHIGVNGNWYVGETDTGIQAQGLNGNDGTNAFLQKYTIDLLPLAWDSNIEQELEIEGFDPDSNVLLISPSPSSAVDFADYNIYVSAENIGAIVFKASSFPSVPISVVIVIGAI